MYLHYIMHIQVPIFLPLKYFTQIQTIVKTVNIATQLALYHVHSPRKYY